MLRLLCVVVIIARSSLTLSAVVVDQAVVARALGPEGTRAAGITAVRAYGPAGLMALQQAYDLAPARLDPAAWDAVFDAVGQCRGCRLTGLYWYTDLAAAQAEARARGKPIIALRLLGRLTDEYSCANSRFFRVVLYADPFVRAWLHDQAVLYWSSERPVPQVSIDFGDGRVLRTTLGGNSVHVVMDAEGRVIDAIPGLLGPRPFLDSLRAAAAVAHALSGLDPVVRQLALRRYHQEALDRIDAEFALVTAHRPPSARDGGPWPMGAAELVSLSKSAVEVPILARMSDAPGTSTPLLDPGLLERLVRRHPEFGQLDVVSQATIARQLAAAHHAVTRLPEDALGTVGELEQVERHLAEDTVLNALVLHADIHEQLLATLAAPSSEPTEGSTGAAGRDGTVATLPPEAAAFNRWIYATLFRTPASDPWLGLAGVVWDGLDHDTHVTSLASR